MAAVAGQRPTVDANSINLSVKLLHGRAPAPERGARRAAGTSVVHDYVCVSVCNVHDLVSSKASFRRTRCSSVT
jgi:hypothetical protein